MNIANFVPVQTVTAEGQVIWHDDSTSYFDWLTKFEQRKNAEYVPSPERFSEPAADPEPRKKKRIRRKKEVFVERLAMYEKGCSDAEIAEAQDVPADTIYSWRYNRKLPKNEVGVRM